MYRMVAPSVAGPSVPTMVYALTIDLTIALTLPLMINYLKGSPPALTTSKALSYSTTYRGMQKQAYEETHAPTHCL